MLPQIIGEVLMVCVDHNLLTFQYLLELLEHLNNCQHLLVQCHISFLRAVELVQEERDGFSLLFDNAAHDASV